LNWAPIFFAASTAKDSVVRGTGTSATRDIGLGEGIPG
jgi:hypothetical protein